jgi:hypothetical protein
VPDLSGGGITPVSILGIDKDLTIDGTSSDPRVILSGGGSVRLQDLRVKRRSIPMTVILREPEAKGVMPYQSE